KKFGRSNSGLVHELWLSKEPAEVSEKCAEDGFISQLKYQSVRPTQHQFRHRRYQVARILQEHCWCIGHFQIGNSLIFSGCG
ncbi:hypothetical protein B9Z19DRAFT_985069, partial [Tuber borchii]